MLLRSGLLAALCGTALATIYDNTLQRPHVEIDTAIPAVSAATWKSYKPSAKEIAYLGRWDKKYISWWSSPGIKFDFLGDKVALSFGNCTTNGTLIAWRVEGLDWEFTNVTAFGTHQLVTSRPYALGDPYKIPATLEMRVTNWGYGVQLAGVHVAKNATIIKSQVFNRRIEFIGDSLSTGYAATYEGVSSYAFGLGYGLGETEFSVTAYPGICAADQNCWGNPRGQVFQWKQTQDGNWRQQLYYPGGPEPWDFKAHPAADLVFINLGTNDNNTHNNVTNEAFQTAYTKIVADVHSTWPAAQIVLISLWNGFGQVGETFEQGNAFKEEIYAVYKYFNSPKYLRWYQKPFVHYFNSTGVMQHNDIGPGTWHPSDIGLLKLATHLMQYVHLKFGWELRQTGPMVQSGMYIYNDEVGY